VLAAAFIGARGLLGALPGSLLDVLQP
jgi:hypothetical protein